MDASRSRKLVVAALIAQSGHILLSQRRSDQSMPNKWELPGGKIESGESPQDALAREIQEELGCNATVGEIYDVVFHAYPEFDLYMLIYHANLLGEPQAQEVSAVRWVPHQELPDMDLLPADRPLAQRLALASIL